MRGQLPSRKHGAEVRDGGGEDRFGNGFGWLREYGNGKTDAAGLILSTVLLMTMAAPLGCSADLATPDTMDSDPAPPIECMHHQSAQHLSEPFDVPAQPLVKEQHALPLSVGVGVGEYDTGGGGVVESHRGGRVGALQFRAPSRVSPISVARVVMPTQEETSPTTAVGSHSRNGLASKVASEAASTVRVWGEGIVDRAKDFASRGRERKRDAVGDIDNVHVKRSFLHVSEARGDSSSERDAPAPPRGGKRVVRLRIGSDDSGVVAAPVLQMEALKPPLPPGRATPVISLERMQMEYEHQFQASLPVPTLPESFTRDLRLSLPVSMPPAMTLFFLVSMPAVTLLLKGVGTTLVAVVKGYGKGDGCAAPLDTKSVDTTAISRADGGGGSGLPNGKGEESAGYAFGYLLGGESRSRGKYESDADNARHSRGSSGDTSIRSVTSGKSDGISEKASESSTFLPKWHVQTERRGFFTRAGSAQNPSTRGESNGDGRNGGATVIPESYSGVSHDAIAAMAMAAMTKELDLMKQSLEAEVGDMRRDLEQASYDSCQLTDKLRRLEEENKQLGAVVSRLGGRDARRLKAQLLSLLSTPSAGEGSVPQLALA